MPFSMKVRIKKRGAFGIKKIALDGKIEKVERSENPVNPGNHGVSIFFKGVEGLGVIRLSPKESEMVAMSAMPKKDKQESSVKPLKKKAKKKTKKRR